uniref:Uncharacterized protein AlNc14C74G5028 n=1 Tax=Albugo laibachii Nc14 TaxID=890382 RepID=F0WEH5_9STRA|nr:conserved hypothetical protein [Albugo laibachii Nc14]|eukprot:CCA19607.1 conserved hypothetical protein [Albugo laibachii Nc14]
MSLSLDQSDTATYLRFVARFCGVSTNSASFGPIRLRLGKTETFECNTIIRFFARRSEREAELYGKDALEKASASMWLERSRQLNSATEEELNDFLEELDSYLAKRTYIVADRVTLADAVLFYALYPCVKDSTAAGNREGNLNDSEPRHLNVIRWFDQIQHTVGVQGFPSREVVHFKRKDISVLM